MVDARRATVFAATLTILLSMPVASQQIDIQESADGFKAFVDTEFSTSFSLNITEGLEEIKMLDSESKYSFSRRPSKSMEKIVSSKGLLRVKRTPNVSLKVVETPYGTLKTGFRNGDNISQFSGPKGMRPRVVEIRRQLMANMSVSSREASARKRSVVDKMLPEIEISSNYSADVLNITNKDNETVSLSGWSVVKSGESEDPYPLMLDSSLESGEILSFDVGVDNDDSLVLENNWGKTVDLAE